MRSFHDLLNEAKERGVEAALVPAAFEKRATEFAVRARAQLVVLDEDEHGTVHVSSCEPVQLASAPSPPWAFDNRRAVGSALLVLLVGIAVARIMALDTGDLMFLAALAVFSALGPWRWPEEASRLYVNLLEVVDLIGGSRARRQAERRDLRVETRLAARARDLSRKRGSRSRRAATGIGAVRGKER